MKCILLIVLALCAFVTARARTALDFFVDAPDNEVPLLSQPKRLDMVDYFNNGLANTVVNELAGNSRIVEASEKRLVAQLADHASLELDVLVSGNDTVIALITTVLLPMADSDIVFYDSNWQPLRHQPAMPAAAEFASDAARADELMAAVPMFFVKATYRPDDDVFVFTNTSAAYFAENERPDVLLAIPASIERRFRKGKWRKL